MPCTILRHLSSLKLNKAAFFFIPTGASESRRLIQKKAQ